MISVKYHYLNNHLQ